MTKTLTRRIRKLASLLQPNALPPVVLRYDSLKRLPNDVSCERHIVASKREPTSLPNVQRCEFEERVGPAPVVQELSFDIHLSLDGERCELQMQVAPVAELTLDTQLSSIDDN